MAEEFDFVNWIIPGINTSEKGGAGSGNFGHADVPGHRGGSAPRNNAGAAPDYARKSPKDMTDEEARNAHEYFMKSGNAGMAHALAMEHPALADKRTDSMAKLYKKPVDAQRNQTRETLLKWSMKKLRSQQSKISDAMDKLIKDVPEADKLEGAQNKSPATLRYETAANDYQDVTWAITNHPSWKKKEVTEKSNPGHAGRPGHRGGSSPRGAAGDEKPVINMHEHVWGKKGDQRADPSQKFARAHESGLRAHSEDIHESTAAEQNNPGQLILRNPNKRGEDDNENQTRHTTKGGQGSGNFGHAGIPGHLGGSATAHGEHAGITKATCPTCGGEGEEMGKLGNLSWLKCRNCGMEFNKRVGGKRKKKYVPPTPTETKETSEKGGAGSGNFGHAGRPGKVGGSAGGKAEGGSAGGKAHAGMAAATAAPHHGGSYEHMGSNAPDPAHHIHATAIKHPDGFTYQPVLNNTPKKGMAVSIYPEREEILNKGDLTVKKIRDFMKKNADLLIDPRNHVGGWLKKDTKQFFLDISVVKASRSQAAKLCRQYHQFSFFDLGKGEEVPVKGAREESKEKQGSNSKENWIRFELPNSPSDEELQQAIDNLMANLDENEGEGDSSSQSDSEGKKS